MLELLRVAVGLGTLGGWDTSVPYCIYMMPTGLACPQFLFLGEYLMFNELLILILILFKQNHEKKHQIRAFEPNRCCCRLRGPQKSGARSPSKPQEFIHFTKPMLLAPKGSSKSRSPGRPKTIENLLNS